MDSPARPVLDRLRADIVRLEARDPSRPRAVHPFGLAPLDACLPGGGLQRAALHEVAGGGADVVHGTAAALFAAGILARLHGPVLWCLTRPDLFAPALAQAGLHPDRVIFVEAGDDAGVLACAEEGLRHGGLGSVVAEVGKLPMTASRSVSGMSCSMSSVVRTTMGMMMMASATAPARPENWPNGSTMIW